MSLRRGILWVGAAALLAYGALIAGLFALQRYAFYPGWWRGTADVAFDRAAFRDVATRTEDGLRGRLLYAAPRGDRPVILFLHGNGDSVADWLAR